MKPTIHGPVVHSDRPRQHSRLHRPLRFTWFDPRLKRHLTREEETRRKLDRLETVANVGFIIAVACIAAAAVVIALGLRGYLP